MTLSRPIAVLALFAFAPVAADYELGLAAYDAGDYETARREWLPVAEAGLAEAQYRLGRLYYYGRGVDPDPVEAARWYRLAAEQGHARSQSNLGFLYQSGEGLPRSDAEAAVWFARAAEQGRAVAQYRLGRIYETGRGLPRDEARAADWYERAAKQGLAEAIFDLARLLESGRGVAQDRKRAARLYRRAARKGITTEPGAGPSEDADLPDAAAVQRATPTAVTEVPDTPTAPVPAQPVPAAFAATKALAERGEPEAQFRLAELYRSGSGVGADPAEAARWYRAAAEQGHGLAAYRLAFLYYRGHGASDRPDFVQAYLWFARAAEADIGDAGDWRDRIGKKLTARERVEVERLRSDNAGEDPAR